MSLYAKWFGLMNDQLAVLSLGKHTLYEIYFSS